MSRSVECRNLLVPCLAALIIVCSDATPATARVTELLRDDGDVGDPLPNRIYIGYPNTLIILGDNHGDDVASVRWYATVSGPGGCSRDEELGNNTDGISVQLSSLGTAVIKVDITYQEKSTDPPTTPAPNTVSGTITIYPPSGFDIVPFDQTQEYMIQNADMNGRQIFFQLKKDGESDAPGYNLGPEEKILYLDANGDPTGVAEKGGAWLRKADAPALSIDSSGLIGDGKSVNFNTFPNVGLGQILFKYKQVIGVYYIDWCGTLRDIELGSVTFTATRSATDFNRASANFGAFWRNVGVAPGAVCLYTRFFTKLDRRLAEDRRWGTFGGFPWTSWFGISRCWKTLAPPSISSIR